MANSYYKGLIVAIASILFSFSAEAKQSNSQRSKELASYATDKQNVFAALSSDKIDTFVTAKGLIFDASLTCSIIKFPKGKSPCAADNKALKKQYSERRRVLTANSLTCQPYLTDIFFEQASIGEPYECLELALGQPQAVNETKTAYSDNYQLHYESGNRYVYIEHNAVTTIQGHNNPTPTPWFAEFWR